MGEKTIERTFADNRVDKTPKGGSNEIMLLGVEATDAAKDAIQKLGFVHTVSCCPGICPGTQKLLRHRNGQRKGKRAHKFKGLKGKIRGKLRVVGFDSLPNCFRNVVWVKTFEQKNREHTLEFKFLSTNQAVS